MDKNNTEAIDYIVGILKMLIGTENTTDFTVFDLIRVIGTIIGFCLLFIAIIRLSKHGKTQQMFRYYAPSTTILMLFSGVMLLSMTGFLEMVSTALFQDTSLNPINTISAYADGAEKSKDINIAQQYLVFSLLAIVGFISLIRGVFLLIKVSEGQHEGGIGQVVSHLIAGVVGMNAAYCMTILNNIYDFKQYMTG
ncbi:hypothetical protein [Fastidiosibacter lacustris]|uniref:hypothetical protein n=1 Tax=Fastidiosibacter lacustris TaxID=2056695 RepID=UPI000E3481FF|nr:hypothetical protein [Fastidiosibacter lacustris]